MTGEGVNHKQPRRIGRRKFVKLAASTVSGAVAARAMAQSTPAAAAPVAPTTAPATAPASQPSLPLGNGEPPCIQFQPCPGGNAAYLEKLSRQNGEATFKRQPIQIEPWNGLVPSTEEDIAFLPVHRLASLIQSRKLSAVELTRIYLDRLKRLDRILLCAVTIMDGPAREAAQQADAEIKAGNYRGPLHGIPYGVKDLFSVRGFPTTWGADVFADRVIDEDAEIVVRLRDAGAILIAKLATGRFALGDQWFRGRTNNPWNPKQGSSGSSAGSASATVAGCVGFGIGTETRGSIVSPAVRCGVSALRPTFGRISRHGGMVLAWSMDRVGPICRTVEDCALVFNAIHGVDEKDPATITAPFQWQRSPDLSRFRIGYDPQAPKAFVEKLRELGADLKPIGPRPRPRNIDVLDIESAAAFDAIFSAGVLREDETREKTGRFSRGRSISALGYMQSQRRRQILNQEMAKVMKDFDLYASGGGDVVLTSLTCHPAVILPWSFSEGENPQPVCTTLIGDLFADDKILSVAHAYQRATQWHTKRPKLPM